MLLKVKSFTADIVNKISFSRISRPNISVETSVKRFGLTCGGHHPLTNSFPLTPFRDFGFHG